VSTWQKMMLDCTLLWRPVDLFNNALRHAGVGKNLKTDGNWGRFCLVPINSTTPISDIGPCVILASKYREEMPFSASLQAIFATFADRDVPAFMQSP